MNVQQENTIRLTTNELMNIQLKDYASNFKPMIADLINKNKRKTGISFSEEDIDDLLQDCILIAYEKSLMSDFILESKLSTFLYGIANNKIHEKLRKKQQIITGEYNDEIEVLKQDEYDSLIDEETNFKLKLIKDCMKLLSKTQLKVFDLFFIKNFSLNKIAIEVGSNEDSMKSQNYKAKTSIKNCVQLKMA